MCWFPRTWRASYGTIQLVAIGKRIKEGPKGAWREIVGVVSDERDDGVDKKAPTIVYWPLMVRHFWQFDSTAGTGARARDPLESGGFGGIREGFGARRVVGESRYAAG